MLNHIRLIILTSLDMKTICNNRKNNFIVKKIVIHYNKILSKILGRSKNKNDQIKLPNMELRRIKGFQMKSR
jgi:hypothetical protein